MSGRITAASVDCGSSKQIIAKTVAIRSCLAFSRSIISINRFFDESLRRCVLRAPLAPNCLAFRRCRAAFPPSSLAPPMLSAAHTVCTAAIAWSPGPDASRIGVVAFSDEEFTRVLIGLADSPRLVEQGIASYNYELQSDEPLLHMAKLLTLAHEKRSASS